MRTYIYNQTEFNFYISIFINLNRQKPFVTKYVESFHWWKFEFPYIPITSGIIFHSVKNTLQLKYFLSDPVPTGIYPLLQKQTIYLHQGTEDVRFYFYLEGVDGIVQ